MYNTNQFYLDTTMKLVAPLIKAGIPHAVKLLYDGFAVVFPWANGADTVCHMGSYGHTKGYMETMGFSWDGDDVSVYKPEELAEMIIQEHDKTETDCYRGFIESGDENPFELPDDPFDPFLFTPSEW